MGKKDKTGQPQTPNEVQGRDLFQTPNYAIDLLIPFIPKNIHNIWEPAAGHGKIVKRLQENGYGVYSSDILFDVDWTDISFNFITDTIPDDFPKLDAIITNPPYSLKIKFFKRCLEIGIPFALLIPADYALWNIEAITKYGCEKLIPERRIDYITPNGKSGKDSQGQFHSMWLTRGFGLGKSETFVELTNEEKKENI